MKHKVLEWRNGEQIDSRGFSIKKGFVKKALQKKVKIIDNETLISTLRWIK